MFSLQGLDVLDFKSFNIQIVQPQKRNGIINIESQAEGPYEILSVSELAVGRITMPLIPRTLFGALPNPL